MKPRGTMRPAPRHKAFPVGRICMVCGKGATHKLGGLSGFRKALEIAGYRWDPATTLGFAHISCIIKAVKVKPLDF